MGMATIVKVEAVINGQTYDLSEGSGGTWSATPSAPTKTSGSNHGGQGPGVGSEAKGKGYYPVSIKATDDFGNSTVLNSDDPTWGGVLKLKVLEKTKPSCSLSYPTDGALIKSSRPTIGFTITDSGSGPNPEDCFISIDGQSAIRISGRVGGSSCDCAFSPSSNLSDGEHTVEVFGKDYDGNESYRRSASFTIDTTPPALSISTPGEGTTKTNRTSIRVSGTTNDEGSSPVSIRITGGAQTYTPSVSEGAFSQDVALKENDTNNLVITATDSAGLVSTVRRTVVVNTIPPSISEISLVPNPVDGGKTLTISVTARSS